MRIDKWLWAARFFRTRSLAHQAVTGGRVKLNGERVKPARELKPGDAVTVQIGDSSWEIVVRQLAQQRGPAVVARTLYEETEASQAERQRRADLRRFGPEPAAEMKGRPTKRDRRDLDRLLDE